MIIAGVTCYPNRWPRPDTRLALEWTRTTPIRWRATQRPQSNDQYYSDIEIWDTYDVVNTLYAALKDAANLGAISVTLGTGDEQYIFGADVTCTTATVTEYGMPKEAGSFKMFSLPLRLKALAPTFSGTPEWPSVLYALPGWKAGATVEVSKLSSFDNTMTYTSKGATEGLFECEFDMDTASIRKMRRYLTATVRGGRVIFPDIGVSSPFGPTLPGFTAAYVRVVEWKDMGRVNYLRWRFGIKLAYDGVAV